MNHTSHITSGQLTRRAGFIFISWINTTSLKVQTPANLLSRLAQVNPESFGEAFHLIPWSESLCCMNVM